MTIWALILFVGESHAEVIYSSRFGLNQVTCPAASDTHVSVPFLRLPVVFRGKVAAISAGPSGTAVVTSSGNPSWTAGALAGVCYVRILDGVLAGHWLEISANSSTSLTVDLAGLPSGNLAAGDRFLVLRHWTLDSLFPPAEQTTVHISSGNLPFQQKTKVLLPDLGGSGVDLPADSVCFLTASGWKLSAPGFPSAGSLVIPPGSTLIIRHPGGVADTVFMPRGEVLMEKDAVLLATRSSGPQDNDVAIHRPVSVRLSEAGLDTGAFLASTGHDAAQRKDELLVFDNTAVGFNKPASAVYYRVGSTWYRDTGAGAANPVANNDFAFPAAGAAIIRKATSPTAAVWTNTATYSQP
ncbi:MAG: hypothetical protein Fur0032_11770 [Terrimicrobiaceae bacterium]